MVVTAIVLLIAGFVLGQAFLVMWSIAVSVLSAVFLVIGALLRRHELFPSGGHTGSTPLPPKGPVPAGPMPAPHMMSDRHVPSAPHAMAPQGMRQTATATPQPRMSPVAGRASAVRRGLLDAQAIVLVIPGRKRYHVAGCRQLAGRDHEELTHEEAREEGFTPCTTCLPELTRENQPRDASRGAQEPAASPTPSQEPAAGETRESGAATARFNPPYGPVTSSSPQEAAEARPYAQGSPASQGPAQPQEPAPPLRAGKPADRPVQEPSAVPPSQTSDDSAATSWFSRETVASVTSAPEAPAGSDDSGDEAPAEPESVPPGPAKAETPVQPDSQARPGVAEDETPATPAGSDGPPGPAEREPSAEEQDSLGEPVSAEADGTPEPVEPAETAPGRAGEPVSADSTSEETETSVGGQKEDVPEEAPDEDDEDTDTAPHGIPAVQDGPGPGDAGTVKVIVGTRRFHSSICPLIKGTDGDGIETMPRAEAEEAGLSGCSVCQADR
ncbi:hypothetical protein [Streptosporangium album]|uniref:hypothetical protein n=1 Tax=Streptosporangium album TaxID=47479 RepID=UPI00161378BA|nr:hypothetical protein [Streptosporangium album]